MGGKLPSAWRTSQKRHTQSSNCFDLGCHWPFQSAPNEITAACRMARNNRGKNGSLTVMKERFFYNVNWINKKYHRKNNMMECLQLDAVVKSVERQTSGLVGLTVAGAHIASQALVIIIIFFRSIRVGWAKKKDFLLRGHLLQLLWWDQKAISGQLRDIVSPACLPGDYPRWDIPSLRPEGTSALPGVEKQCSDIVLGDRASHPISKGVPHGSRPFRS